MTKHYCDHCKKELLGKGYRKLYIQVSGWHERLGMDLCEDCLMSFVGKEEYERQQTIEAEFKARVEKRRDEKNSKKVEAGNV